VTPEFEPQYPLHQATVASALARDAHRRRARTSCAALLCACCCVAAAAAKKPHPPKAASSPSTEQILAPSAATIPDALPLDKQVWRCGSSYSGRPCPGSDTKPLDITDARSDAQRRQAIDLTARDKRLAAWYEAARRAREQAASAPKPGRAASTIAVCTSTATMTCVRRKSETRHVTLPAPPKPAPHSPG
jgi:hypothetical protein